MYVHWFFLEDHYVFVIPLRGPLSLAGPTSVLVKFEHIFVIFGCFRGSSTLFNLVLVKVHDSKHRLTQKIFKMYLYEDRKNFHWKNCFFWFYSCYNSYFQIFCHKENKFADLFYLLTYTDDVSSFVSGSFSKTITYIKGLWNVPLQGRKYFLPQTFIL